MTTSRTSPSSMRGYTLFPALVLKTCCSLMCLATVIFSGGTSGRNYAPPVSIRAVCGTETTLNGSCRTSHLRSRGWARGRDDHRKRRFFLAGVSSIVQTLLLTTLFRSGVFAVVSPDEFRIFAFVLTTVRANLLRVFVRHASVRRVDPCLGNHRLRRFPACVHCNGSVERDPLRRIRL